MITRRCHSSIIVASSSSSATSSLPTVPSRIMGVCLSHFHNPQRTAGGSMPYSGPGSGATGGRKLTLHEQMTPEEKRRERVGGMFDEESDTAYFHERKARVNAKVEQKMMKKNQSPQSAGAGGEEESHQRYHGVRGAGGSHGDAEHMTRQQWEEENAAQDEFERRISEDQELLRAKEREREKAANKRTPGMPLPGSREKERQAQQDTIDYFEKNPDEMYSRSFLHLFFLGLMLLVAFLQSRKDYEATVYDTRDYDKINQKIAAGEDPIEKKLY